MSVRHSCALVLFGAALLGGCVSVNSESREDRLAALAGLSSNSDFVDAVFDTRYDDVRLAAVRHVTDPDDLTRIVLHPDFSDDVRDLAVARIRSERCLAQIILSPHVTERHALMAARGLEDADLLLQCVRLCRHGSVSASCVRHITNQIWLENIARDERLNRLSRECAIAGLTSQRVLGDIAQCTTEDWLLCCIVPYITDEGVSKKLIMRSLTGPDQKVMLLNNVDDESFLLNIAKDTSLSDPIRRKSLSRLQNEESLMDVLRNDEKPKTWLVREIAQRLTNQENLKWIVFRRNFPEEVRKSCLGRIVKGIGAERIFEFAEDDLPAREIFPLLDDYYLKGNVGQDAVLRHFSRSEDPSFLNVLLLAMARPNLDLWAKRKDQIKVAKALLANPTTTVLSLGEEALFDQEVLVQLALGKLGDDRKVELWALDLITDAERLSDVVLNSSSELVRCRALARINDEDIAAKVAQTSNERLLRVFAIDKLTRRHEKTLIALAYSEDTVVRDAAIKHLDDIGSASVPKLRRAVDEELLVAADLDVEETAEGKANDEKDARKFEDRILVLNGDFQLDIFRRYREVKRRVDISSPELHFLGRVVSYRQFSHLLTLKVFTSEDPVTISVKMVNHLDHDFRHDDIVQIKGFDNGSTDDQIRLSVGRLVNCGIGL